MPLGGSQYIGASCYYLKIDEDKILLDCGLGMNDKVTFGPSMHALIENDQVTSLSQLNGIFISHAHFDHIGYLPTIIEDNPNIPVFTTHITKEVGQYIMYNGKKLSTNKKAAISNMFYYMNGYGFNEKIHLPHIDITFYQAGHIPGAAMIYIESDSGTVLYTGDFSMNETALTGKCILPDNLSPDTVILCGVHAKHPQYILRDKIHSIIQKTQNCINNGQSVYLKVKQLTKGIEFVNIINTAIEYGEIKDCPIYYDDKIKDLGNYLNQLNIQTFSKRCSKYSDRIANTGVYIGSKKPFGIYSRNIIEADFSLHSDYNDICSLIERLMPKKLFIVHTADKYNAKDEHVLERKFQDITVYYPDETSMYYLI